MTAVLVVTGPVGVGKSAVLQEADAILARAGVSHATVVMEEIARCGPAPSDDPWNARIMWRNLASLWSNYSARGVERLLLEKLVEHREQLRPIYDAGTRRASNDCATAGTVGADRGAALAAERSSTPGVAYARIVAFALVGSGRGGRRMRSSPVVVSR